MHIRQRANKLIDLKYFSSPNGPQVVNEVYIWAPKESQYVLRCPIKLPGVPLTIPNEMIWCLPFIAAAYEYQAANFGLHPFVYLTIRHGEVKSTTDDEWHVDGFSTRIPHVPEQDYIWCDKFPTEVAFTKIEFPADFDPLVHNIHWYIQDHMPQDIGIYQLYAPWVYAIDPYVIHRRPPVPFGVSRTFVRLSFVPIAINDKNNYINPAFGELLPNRDGIKDFRDKLKRYTNE